MKKIYLSLIFVYVAFILNAQTVILSENFQSASGSTPPTGWTRTQATGSNGWKFGTSLGSQYWVVPAHTVYAASNDDDCNCDMSQDFLISPVLNLTSYSSVILTFQAFFTGEYSSTAYVKVSTNGGTSWTTASTLSPSGLWQSVSVNLTAYAGQSNVKIAFYHNDNADWASGFAIDDVSIIQPMDYDLAMLEISTNEFQQVGSFDVTGVIQNNGGQTINTADLNWQIDGGAVNTYNASSLNITPTSTKAFTHNIQATLGVIGTYQLKVWVSNPNGNADMLNTNDTLSKTINTLSTIPTKKVVIEEATGAWCGYCPDGAVKLMQILQAYPDDAIGYAIHNGDGMAFTNGNTINTAYISGFPSGLVDRFKFADASSVEQDRGEWMTRVGERLSHIVPVSIDLTNSYNPTTRALTVNVTAEFFGNSQGDIRLNCIIVEDSVSGSGSQYDQVNYYNTTASHPMYGLGDPILGYQHRHVLRSLLGGSWGTAGIISSSVSAGQTFTKTYTTTLTSTWNASRIKLVALVQRYNANSDSREILNASEHELTIVTGMENITNNVIWSVYPNPFYNITNVSYVLENESDVNISVYDNTGKLVYNQINGKMSAGNHFTDIDGSEWSAGMYLIQIRAGESVFSKKIILNK